MPTQTADSFNYLLPPPIGAGIADALNMASSVGLVPAAPTGLALTPYDGGLGVSWDAAAAVTGITVDGYIVTATDGETLYTVITDDTGFLSAPGVYSGFFPGLTNDVLWTVEVVTTSGVLRSAALSGSGTPTAASGAPSSTLPVFVVVPQVPGSPSLVLATPSDGYALVAWTLPLNTGGKPLVRAEVTFNDGNPLHVPVVALISASITSMLIGGLTNGVTYAVTVRVSNSVGWSLPSPSLPCTPATGLPQIPDPNNPVIPVPQPMLDAFPETRYLRPANWMLTPEEADHDVIA